MSRRRWLLGTLLLSLSLGACSPATQPRTVATPKPIVVKPEAPAIDRAKLRAALSARRDTVVARFLAYRDAGVYPINTFSDQPEHIWLDAYGHLCAAATLVSEDWGYSAAANVSLENNFIKMADVHDGPLSDWVLTSGLTHHEIVSIQVLPVQPDPEEQRNDQETARLYTLYVDVERQLRAMWDESLDDATDALMKRPDLARALIDGVASGPGRFAADVATLEPASPDASPGFAQPPG
jgi:hypothetical protein